MSFILDFFKIDSQIAFKIDSQIAVKQNQFLQFLLSPPKTEEEMVFISMFPLWQECFMKEECSTDKLYMYL